MGYLVLSFVTTSASLLLLLTSSTSALPVKQDFKREAEGVPQNSTTRTLLEGLVIFRQIVRPRSRSSLTNLIQIHPDTATILCSELPEDTPECWRDELQLYCQWQLHTLVRSLVILLTGDGLSLDLVQWIRTELDHVPNSEAKGYICDNFCAFCTNKPICI